MPRSPDATQRRQFRFPITPIAHWAHSGAPMRRYGSPIARRRAHSHAAEHPQMAARAASAARAAPRKRKKKVPRSPDATQRRQFRYTTTSSAHWAHPGASMQRDGSPITRRRARSRAAEHPKMAAARAASASAARAGVEEAKKVPPTPNATQGRKFRSPIAPSAPWGRPGA